MKRAPVLLMGAWIALSATGCELLQDYLKPRRSAPEARRTAPEPSTTPDPVNTTPKVVKPETKLDPKAIDLGTARVPEGTAGAGAVFDFDASKSRYRLGYVLSQKESTGVDKFYKDWAASVGFKRVDEKAFTWRPGPGCPTGLGCVYTALIKRTKPDIDAITARIKARVVDKKLPALEAAQLALSFVQAIPYKIPPDPFGIKPPPLVVWEEFGDCDSKALLLHMMLTGLGVHAVIVTSKAHAHTMVGVALPVNGTTFEYKGTKYAFAETTALNSPLGFMNPKLRSPSDWRVDYVGEVAR